MKLLLYCTKAKPYLYGKYGFHLTNDKRICITHNVLNGKIVAECNYECEEIGQHRQFLGCGYDLFFETDTLEDLELQKKACLNTQQLNSYFMSNADNGEKVGYAIHIENLHIFDEPKELSEYYKGFTRDEIFSKIERINTTPQNMMYAYKNTSYSNTIMDKYVLISIKPEWLCKILNGEKTIEVRKKVLKEMK